MRKSLIYHICPLKTNDLWKRNLDQLLARIDIFDGYRNIAIAIGDDERIEPVETVLSYLRGVNCQIIRVRNDRNLREVASFKRLLDSIKPALQPTSSNDAIFYAHTKGNSTYDDPLGAVYWRNVMYHELLDKWERAIDLLQSGYCAVGTHKVQWKVGQRCPYPSGLRHGNWMFAGTFFWFNAYDVFNNPKWSAIPQDRYGAEAWLSGMFEAEHCKSVWQPWPVERSLGQNPYDPDLYIRNNMAISDVELQHPSYSI